ncbi:MAG: hypothetical protein R2707_19520 [Acidimicrobiales bacterium]
MQNKTLATAAVASTLGGALAGATLLAPGLAGAQDDVDAPDAVEETVRPEAGDRITEALQGLVDDGTITQAQLDAVVETLLAARPEGGMREHGGRHGFEGGADIAGILGLDQSELRDAIAGGQSLADVAAAQGVDTQDLIDALVDAAEERVSGALENGRIDQEKADEILANAEQRAEDLVNGDVSFEGRRGRGGPRGEVGGDIAVPDADA